MKLRLLFLTDFSCSKELRQLFFIVSALDFLSAHTLKHALILFGLPYVVSIGQKYYFYKKRPRRSALKSAQFRSTSKS